MIDLTVARDLINILHPFLSYREMIDGISLKREEVLSNSPSSKDMPAERLEEAELTSEERIKLYYSKYDHEIDQLNKEPELNVSVKPPNIPYVNITIGSVVFGVRNSNVGRALV